MKILWFSQNSASLPVKGDGYNGCGWVASLEQEIKKCPNIQLAICFMTNGKQEKLNFNETTYYALKTPRIPLFTKIINHIKNNYIEEEKALWPCYRKMFNEVIQDFKPDIIQIFGTENKFGLIGGQTNIPTLIHIQGIITPCLNAYLPPFTSWFQYYLGAANLKDLKIKLSKKKQWEALSYCEINSLKNIKNYLGRTDWDFRVTKIFNETAAYYHCNEILRDTFYHPTQRKLPSQLTIISTISSPPYKGYDLILKTAFILKNIMNLDFSWKIYGSIDYKQIEKIFHIYHKDVNISLCGIATAEELKNSLQNATLYFHPSYIDNSPNSVCEAQILRCPVIATNVGGVSSLIKDKETGFLIPSNDPYQGAYLIKELYNKKDLNNKIGIKAQEEALLRHDKNKIINELLEIYQSLIHQ